MVLDEIPYAKNVDLKASAADEATASQAQRALQKSSLGAPEAGLLAASLSGFENRMAKPLDRLAAVLADLVIFVPIMGVIISPMKKAALLAQLLGNEADWLSNYLTTSILGFLLFVVYQTAFVAIWGATPGKRVFGLKVESIWTGQKPQPMAAFVRSLCWCAELLAAAAPSIAVFGNEKRRPFHDRIADTAVVVASTDRSKIAALPSLSELTIASGATAACLAAFSVFVIGTLAKLHSDLRSPASALAAEMEEKGLLCKSVGEAKTDWTLENVEENEGATVTSRLPVALALFAAESIDESCLEMEADFSIWRNEDKTLAYLAKALVHADDQLAYNAYMDKVCEGDTKSPACGVSHMLRHDTEETADASDTGEKAEAVAGEQTIEEFIQKADQSSPDYFKIWVIRRLMDEGRFTEALARIDSVSPHKSVGFFFARARVQALWNLERHDESRLALRSSFGTLDNDQRVAVSQWLCYSETAEEGCNENSRYACGLLQASVDRADAWLENSEVAVAYIRGESCRSGLSPQRLSRLEEKLPDGDAKNYLLALSHLKKNERAKAVAILDDLATDKGEVGSFFIEANVQLADLAATSKELGKIKKAWQTLPPGEEWRYLGLHLTNKFNALRAFDQALDVGLKMVDSERFDRQLYKSLVVSAFRSGHAQMALGFLQNIQRFDEPLHVTELFKPQRVPASTDDFTAVSQELLSKRKGAL
jgi:uncharacterized RDD family membrane protein YckC